MNILLNGRCVELPEPMSVSKMLAELGYMDQFVAVAVNRSCVNRQEYASVVVKELDEVEVLAPMAGG